MSAPDMMPVSSMISVSLPTSRDDLGQQVERHRRPVELAAAVVGQHDAVDADVDDSARVLDGLHALDDDLARPLRL